MLSISSEHLYLQTTTIRSLLLLLLQSTTTTTTQYLIRHLYLQTTTIRSLLLLLLQSTTTTTTQYLIRTLVPTDHHRQITTTVTTTGLISRIPGLLYGFFLCFSFFSSFQLSFFLPFQFFCLRSLISPITVCFLIFYFFTFLVPFKTFLVFF